MGPCACRYNPNRRKENEVKLHSQFSQEDQKKAAKIIWQYYRKYKIKKRPNNVNKYKDYEKFISKMKELKMENQLVEVF